MRSQAELDHCLLLLRSGLTMFTRKVLAHVFAPVVPLPPGGPPCAGPLSLRACPFGRIAFRSRGRIPVR